MNQPIENRPTFNICNSSLAHSILYHMYYKIDQHDSSYCKGIFGLLHFMGSNTMIFAVVKARLICRPYTVLYTDKFFTLIKEYVWCL